MATSSGLDLSPRQRAAVGVVIIPTTALLTVNGIYLDAAHQSDPLYFWLLDVTLFLVIPLISLWALWRFAGVGPSHYGLRPLGNRARPLRSLLIYLVFIVAFALMDGAVRVAAIFVPLLWDSTGSSYSYAVPLDPALAWAAILYFSVSAAFVEETFFRGLLFLYVRSRCTAHIARTVYPLASGVLFALIHWEDGSYKFVATFLLGLVLGALYAWTKNLWGIIFGHAATDILHWVGVLGESA